MIIVINATNIGIGGGLTHLKEFLSNALEITDKNVYFVFAQNKVLCQLYENSRLVKKTHPLLEKSLLHRLYFQFFCFDKVIPHNAIIFSITGDYLGKYSPVIGMAQNMLLYERRYWKAMNFVEKTRFFVNFLKQRKCFRNCSGLIFNSKFSQNYISDKLCFVKTKVQKIIHHGVSEKFEYNVKKQLPIQHYTKTNPFVFIYISTIHTYKNHPNVVQAISELIDDGYPLQLNLLGAIIDKKAGKALFDSLKLFDPGSENIVYHGFVNDDLLNKYYDICDGVIYASSCETMPITVIETMVSGRPLVCSNKGPIPEFVIDNASYFDPEDVISIKSAIIEFLLSPIQREKYAISAQIEAKKYQWKTTTLQTIDFINEVYNKYYGITASSNP